MHAPCSDPWPSPSSKTTSMQGPSGRNGQKRVVSPPWIFRALFLAPIKSTSPTQLPTGPHTQPHDRARQRQHSVFAHAMRVGSAARSDRKPPLAHHLPGLCLKRHAPRPASRADCSFCRFVAFARAVTATAARHTVVIPTSCTHTYRIGKPQDVR